MAGQKFTSVEEYMSTMTGTTKERLDIIRSRIFALVPGVSERISYNIPAYFVGTRMVVYFSGYANHTSLYPLHFLDQNFQKKAAKYASGKSTFKMPNSDPLPLELIDEFIQTRASEAKAG